MSRNKMQLRAVIGTEHSSSQSLREQAPNAQVNRHRAKLFSVIMRGVAAVTATPKAFGAGTTKHQRANRKRTRSQETT